MESEPDGSAADLAAEMGDFASGLMMQPDREQVASEIGVLQSIYGDDAIHLWHPSRVGSPEHTSSGSSPSNGSKDTIRYVVSLSLPSHEDVSIRILVSLLPSYPAESPPQLQLISRYIGAFGVDASLFGSILRMFISISGVEWSPDTVCVFDGLQSVLERCEAWYEDKLSREKVDELVREDTLERDSMPQGSAAPTNEDEEGVGRVSRPPILQDVGLPEGIKLVEAEPIVDRKSVFVGRACQISHPSQVPLILNHLMSDRHITRAAHPIINAWRCQVGNVLHQDNDDDGETAAGSRLAHLLSILEINSVLVVVTRWFGGIHLGPDRFKHINHAARNALEMGGFLDQTEGIYVTYIPTSCASDQDSRQVTRLPGFPIFPQHNDTTSIFALFNIVQSACTKVAIRSNPPTPEVIIVVQNGKHNQYKYRTYQPSDPLFKLIDVAPCLQWGLKDPTLIKSQGYIDGKWVDAAGGETILVTNPATAEELGTIPEMGLEETKAAITAASKAFQTWGKTTAKYRHDILMKFFGLMQEHHEDLARIITLENGKTLMEAKVRACPAVLLELASSDVCLTNLSEQIPSPISNIRNVVVKQPVGKSIFTPWNFPSAMITRKLGAALAAGCTAVIKPPPETPFSALALAELSQRAGIPDGVINMVTTQKNVQGVGREMCESKVVRKISFTGSTAVAKSLYTMSASTMKKVSIEAGGNSPFIVFDDANIEQAVEGAVTSKFRSSGQTCICANRIYVQSSVYADFASRLAEKVAAFKVGNGLDATTTHGPLIHDRAVAKVIRHVDDAVALGASVLIGGHAPNTDAAAPKPTGSFYPPTVLSDVSPKALVNSEETFGPIAALIKFETEEEVIGLANDSDAGLAGYFYSRDVGRVWRVAEALEVGMVGTNTGLIGQACIPFGGVKQSGLGREGGHGIEEYLNQKLIVFGGL
ncbi:Aldehyde/histidinol dehydrogenase [Chiua virens]|nr:Aldehyde/histidinol dehydrogenase [Chiua virens]